MPTTHSVIDNTQWTNLGPSPVFIDVTRGDVLARVDSAAPASPDLAAHRLGPRDTFNHTFSGNLYVRASTARQGVTVTAGVTVTN